MHRYLVADLDTLQKLRLEAVVRKIEVSCAIIEKDGLVLAAQRSESMSLPLKWEFPGGKLLPQETAADCLIREIKEELGIDVTILSTLSPSDWHYPGFAITLYPFVCNFSVGSISLSEHKRIAWVRPEELLGFDWAEADVPVVQSYLAYLGDIKYAQ
jgi:8-oxo-dGTP diphosphatase